MHPNRMMSWKSRSTVEEIDRGRGSVHVPDGQCRRQSLLRRMEVGDNAARIGGGRVGDLGRLPRDDRPPVARRSDSSAPAAQGGRGVAARDRRGRPPELIEGVVRTAINRTERGGDMTSADEMNRSTEPRPTEATIDLTAQCVEPPGRGFDDLRLRLHERARPAAAPLRQGHAPAVGRVRPDRLERRRRLREPARRSRREHHARRHAVLGEDERPRAGRGPPQPGRVAVLAVPARRAGRADVRVEDREHGPDDRREVLRRDAGHRRGPPRRGVRPLPAREARPRVPAEQQPAVAARRRADRQPLGHDVPRDAGAHRRARARRVQPDPQQRHRPARRARSTRT